LEWHLRSRKRLTWSDPERFKGRRGIPLLAVKTEVRHREDKGASRETVLLPGKQVRAFRECDQKSGWRQPVPTVKASGPYDNEVVKRWTAEITKTTVTQRELSLTGGTRMSSAKMVCEL
jgi:Cys-tRNA synthase (O-phospho-L-seryl-tRNA:Cys-tRNA synthase)